MNSGRYALQERGCLWGWNYFCSMISEDIALWDTQEEVQLYLDRQLKKDSEKFNQVAEVVKEV